MNEQWVCVCVFMCALVIYEKSNLWVCPFCGRPNWYERSVPVGYIFLARQHRITPLIKVKYYTHHFLKGNDRRFSHVKIDTRHKVRWGRILFDIAIIAAQVINVRLACLMVAIRKFWNCFIINIIIIIIIISIVKWKGRECIEYERFEVGT